MKLEDQISKYIRLRKSAHLKEVIDDSVECVPLFDSTNIRYFIEYHSKKSSFAHEVGSHLSRFIKSENTEIFVFQPHMVELIEPLHKLMTRAADTENISEINQNFCKALEKCKSTPLTPVSMKEGVWADAISLMNENIQLQQLGKISSTKHGLKTVKSRNFFSEIYRLNPGVEDHFYHDLDRLLDRLSDVDLIKWSSFFDVISERLDENKSQDNSDKFALLHLFALNLFFKNRPKFHLFTTRGDLFEMTANFYPFENESSHAWSGRSFSDIYLRDYLDVDPSLVIDKDLKALQADFSASVFGSVDSALSGVEVEGATVDFSSAESFLGFFKNPFDDNRFFESLSLDPLPELDLFWQTFSLRPSSPDVPENLASSWSRFIQDPKQNSSQLLKQFTVFRRSLLDSCSRKFAQTLLRTSSSKNASFPRLVPPPIFADLNLDSVRKLSQIRNDLPMQPYIDKLVDIAIDIEKSSNSEDFTTSYFHSVMLAYTYSVNGMWTSAKISANQALALVKRNGVRSFEKINGREASYYVAVAGRMGAKLETDLDEVRENLLYSKHLFYHSSPEFNGARVFVEEINLEVTSLLFRYFETLHFDTDLANFIVKNLIPKAGVFVQNCDISFTKNWSKISLNSSVFSVILLANLCDCDFKFDSHQLDLLIENQLQLFVDLFGDEVNWSDLAPLRDSVLLAYAISHLDGSSKPISNKRRRQFLTLKGITLGTTAQRNFPIFHFDALRLGHIRDVLSNTYSD